MEVEAKVKWLVLFVDYLKTARGIVGSSEVGSVLSGVKFQWKRRCINDDFFANGALIQAKHGARLMTEEIRAAALVKEQTMILPEVVEMDIWIRVKHWVDRKGLDQKGTYCTWRW